MCDPKTKGACLSQLKCYLAMLSSSTNRLSIFVSSWYIHTGDTSLYKKSDTSLEKLWCNQISYILDSILIDGIYIYIYMRKRDIFITFPFSNNARKAFKITKDIYAKLQKMYPNVFKGELMCSFKRNKNVGDYLVSAKLK